MSGPGIRPLATRIPSELRSDLAKRAAQTFSQIISAAVLFGSSADPISCLYDITPTEDFVLDRVGRVTLATGFSGHGFKFGPVLGELLADLVDGADALDRFRLATL